MKNLYQNKYFIPAFSTLIILLLLSLWVPISLNTPSIYFGADNFHGIKPRAIIGSIIYILPIDSQNVNFTGNVIKLISIYIWLFLISSNFYQSIFQKNNWAIDTNSTLIYLALAFIFEASSITFITYSASGIIDAFPAALVAIVITSNLLTGQKNVSISAIILITGLLVLATWSHEKTIYDIAILLIWYSFIWGIKKGLLYFAPALILSIALIVRMAHKVTSGESAVGYLEILSSGLDFFWNYGFSIWGAIMGGGAFWALYWIASTQLIQSKEIKVLQQQCMLIILMMFVICFAPLLVALDTSRLCALIWLPAVLVMQQVNLRELFCTKLRRITLLLLCMVQMLIPPSLVYERGMAAFNCYGLWVGTFLPKRSEVNVQTRGPFSLSTHSRPDYSDFFRGECD